MNPRVQFRLNRELDCKVGAHFLNLSKAGVSFGAKILKDHPNLDKAKKVTLRKRNEKVTSYVNSFYRKHEKELELTQNRFQQEWDRSSETFFGVVGKLFNKHPWPEGKYIAYVSIFNCNPRFLKDKTFQVYWKHPKGVVAVSTHEMLHFLFYDYVKTNFSKEVLSEGKLWQLSEIFNHFVLAEPPFIKFTGDKHPSLYRDLLGLAQRLRPFWEKNKSLYHFLSTSIKSLSDHKKIALQTG